MKIETVHLDDVTLDPANARKHNARNINAIKDSLTRFGQLKAIVIDAAGVVIAGNGTVVAARELGWETIDAHRVGLEGADAVAYALADNRTAELASWDDDALAKALNGLQQGGRVTGLGFTEAEVARALRGLGGGKDVDDDVLSEPPTDPTTNPGDIWILGDHRLCCGDATCEITVARLLDRGGKNEVEPFMMVTDPPYGVEYEPAWREQAALGACRTGTVDNDDRVDWLAAWQLFTGDVAYVWHASNYVGRVQLTIEDAGFDIRYLLIWAKQRLAISRGAYHWQHEPCTYAVRKGKSARWAGDRKESTLWQIASLGTFGGKADDDDEVGEGTDHGTQKPLECMMRPIRNHGARGDWIYDPFVGSGTTLVACEKLGRRCVAMEINPGYCDVVVARWEKLTGEFAMRGGQLAKHEDEATNP